ncbi:hypothetical protein KPH14_002895 [Odynerus spinipes]|uniref:Uncharacterized protein n=1 Tax=Odynerus spinipes TaxID=1348599 RepID=A0AAD9RWE0_9HYME|nr:hypothetical protein KPH14_002895 [Odynerus spinipes]
MAESAASPGSVQVAANSPQQQQQQQQQPQQQPQTQQTQQPPDISSSQLASPPITGTARSIVPQERGTVRDKESRCNANSNFDLELHETFEPGTSGYDL